MGLAAWRPRPKVFARNRETRTGDQRPKWAENLGFLPKLRAEGSHSLLITILFGNFNSRTQKKSWGKGLAFKGLWRCYPPARAVSPTGRPDGLAMAGRVRNWAPISNGRPVFTKDAKLDSSFTAHEQRLVARAAGQVSSLPRRTRQDPTKPVHAKLGPWTAPTTPDGKMAPLQAFPQSKGRRRCDGVAE